MRIFIALDIDDAIRARIARFVDGVHGFAPEARWAKPESLHVTLKFIGEQLEPAVEHIKHSLSTITATIADIQFRAYGFFRRQDRRASSGLAWKPALNWLRWPRPSTKKWPH